MFWFDFETELFRPGCMLPRPVAMGWLTETSRIQIAHHSEVPRILAPALENDVLVGHYVAYDLGVVVAWYPDLVPLVWRAYDEGRVLCTKVREQLLDLAEGHLGWEHSGQGAEKKSYSLGDLSKPQGFELDKSAESWRLRYGELINVLPKDWPAEALLYLKQDVAATAAVYEDQRCRAKSLHYDLPDQAHQARAAFALCLMSAWGFRTDRARVAAFRAQLEADTAAQENRLIWEGILQQKKGSIKKSMASLRKLVETTFPGATPFTPKGQVRTDADTLEQCDSLVAEAFVAWQSAATLMSGYLKHLEAATILPVHPRFEVLQNNGRTSCAEPNVQNPPRRPGVRECWEPRQGYVYVEVDVDSDEMRGWAQACTDLVGWSDLAERYRADPSFDPHLDFALNQLLRGRISYEDGRRILKDPTHLEYEALAGPMGARQFAKIGNFGLPGGMGEKGLVQYARGYGFKISDKKAREIREAWKAQWPEQDPYFGHIRTIVGEGCEGLRLVQLRSGRWRGLVGYTDASNSYFSGLCADANKAALFECSRRCHAVPTSDLYGCHPINFVHDSILLEAPEVQAPEAAEELVALWVEIKSQWMPDVPSRASAVVSSVWSKKARELRDASGRLQVWRP